jgi:hypothetical protein
VIISRDWLAHCAGELTRVVSLHGQNFLDCPDLASVNDLDRKRRFRFYPDATPIGHAKHRSRSHNAVIRVFDEVGNVIETHQHAGDFSEW